MEFINEITMFILKSATITISILIILVGTIAGIIGYAKKNKTAKSPVKFTRISKKRTANLSAFLNEKFGSSDDFIESKDKIKNSERYLEKVKKTTVFLIEFDGDIEARSSTSFRDEINAVIDMAEEGDELVVKLKSGGGYVHSYGMATELLKRVKKHNIKLTITVDEIAASGGYMMACVADELCAAPFAIIGSVGVVSEFPNFNELLNKHGITYKQYTAGEYKRTVSQMGEITKEAEDKFKKDLENTHKLFKDHIAGNRESVDVESISTGETWYGSKAIENKLVDKLAITEDILDEKSNFSNIVEVKFQKKKNFKDTVSDITSASISKAYTSISGKISESKHAKLG